jgi:hypothetical protein
MKKICPCGKHTLKQYQMMSESKSSSEIEGASTNLTICQLLDLADDQKCEEAILRELSKPN